jgi:hypothetical protein
MFLEQDSVCWIGVRLRKKPKNRGRSQGQPPNPLIVKAIGTSPEHQTPFLHPPAGVEFHLYYL